jgi:choice-of-anchor B domain-containing protein
VMKCLQNIGLLLLLIVQSQQLVGQSFQNITLLDQWHEDSLITNTTLARYSDCFGFVQNGKEYAVIGSTEGTHVFLITDNDQLISKGFIKGRYSSTFVQHREYAVFKNYLYAVCDEGVSSLQIIDLHYLPDSIHLAKEDSLQFGRVHNIFIDTIQEKLYSCIHRSTVNTQTIDSPLKIFSLSDPLNLQELWNGPSDVNEVHDIYVRNGIAILNCGYDGLKVYNFTNTNAPAYLDSKSIYTDQGYNHQGCLTPDGKRYLFADETNGKRVKNCSFNGSIVTINNYFGTNYQNGSVPHNIKATNEFAFVAYYNEGLRIFDLRYPVPLEIAHYDTYPDENGYKMNGNWGIYADLPSKRLLVSDRQYGLFLLNFDQEMALKAFPLDHSINLFPNPVSSSESVFMTLPLATKKVEWQVFDLTGKQISMGGIDYFNAVEIPVNFSAGTYQLKIHLYDQLNNLEQITHKIVVI